MTARRRGRDPRLELVLAGTLAVGVVMTGCATAPTRPASPEVVVDQARGVLDVYTSSPSRPLAGALVTARQGRLDAQSGLSDASGRCRLDLVPGQKYVITVTMAGFHPRAVRGIDVVSHQITTVHLLLREKATAGPR